MSCSRSSGRPAREERRHRQEELVDEPGGDEAAEYGRPAFGQDVRMAPLAQPGDGVSKIELLAERLDGGRRRQLVTQHGLPRSVVMTSAPRSSTGWSRSREPLRVRIASSGTGGTTVAGGAPPAHPPTGDAAQTAQRPFGEPCSVPDPITMTSENARSSPIRKRSASLPAAMILFDSGTDGIATTPSSVETKFA